MRKTNENETQQLSPEQALGYWRGVAVALRSMLAQLDEATPATESLGAMLEDLRDAATSHLVGANALVGHYTMLAADQQQPVAAAVAPQAVPFQQGYPLQQQGWVPQPVQPQPAVVGPQSFVPPARLQSTPGYRAPAPQAPAEQNRGW